MQRYATAEDIGGRNMCPSTDGAFVLNSDAQAEIARLTAKLERNSEIAIHAIRIGGEWKTRAEKAEAELSRLREQMKDREYD